jgi:DNA-binding transcriptional MerR regulator
MPTSNIAPIPVTERILVSEVDASQLCGVSRPTFRSWVSLDLIQPVALPGGIRRRLFLRTDIEALAAKFASHS